MGGLGWLVCCCASLLCVQVLCVSPPPAPKIVTVDVPTSSKAKTVVATKENTAVEYAPKSRGFPRTTAQIVQPQPGKNASLELLSTVVVEPPPPPTTNYALKTVFYINTNGAVERREAMQQQAAKFGMVCQRWAAVETSNVATAQSLFPNLLNNRQVPNRTPKRQAFIVSVYLSHRTLYDHIMQQSAEPDDLFLILEDDATFSSKWKENLLSAIVAAPADWDIVRVGYWGNTRPQDQISTNVFVSRPPSMVLLASGEQKYFYTGMHAYVVRQRTLPNLMQFLDSRSELSDIDVMVTHDNLKSYVLANKIFHSPYGL